MACGTRRLSGCRSVPGSVRGSGSRVPRCQGTQGSSPGRRREKLQEICARYSRVYIRGVRASWMWQFCPEAPFSFPVRPGLPLLPGAWRGIKLTTRSGYVSLRAQGEMDRISLRRAGLERGRVWTLAWSTRGARVTCSDPPPTSTSNVCPSDF